MLQSWLVQLAARLDSFLGVSPTVAPLTLAHAVMHMLVSHCGLQLKADLEVTGALGRELVLTGFCEMPGQLFHFDFFVPVFRIRNQDLVWQNHI